jgi:hypothetical protein
MAGRWVVFHDVTGAVTSAVHTGKEGKATAPVSPHGLVTVAQGTSIQSLVTVASVEPDDAITVGEEEDEGGPDEALCSARVSLPGRHPNAARYAVELGVGAAEILPDTPLRMSIVSRFVERGRFQVLAEAIDDAGSPMAYSHAWFDGCANDGGRASPEARLPAWKTDFRPLVVEVSGGGDAAATLTGTMSIELGGPGDRFVRGSQRARLAEPTTLRFVVPPTLDSKAKLTLTIAGEETGDRFVLEEERASMPEKVAIDLRQHRLPRVSDVVVEEATRARPSIRWRIEGAGATKADVVVVQVSWPATGEHVWTFLLPPDAPQELTLPALPDELASWRPDGRPLTASVALVDASYVDGFSEMKRKGLAALEDPPEVDRVFLRYSVSGALDF